MKGKISLFFLILLVMLVLPGNASAQPIAGGFQGTVTAGGVGIPDDTTISAWIDEVNVGEVQTASSEYSLTILGDYTGKTVVFKVGKYEAEQTSIWKQGEVQTVDLNINSWPYQCDFYGLVTVDGNRVPDGTEVSAWIESARVQVTTTTDSFYRLVVPGNYTNKTVTFKVDDNYARQIMSWERGEEIKANLTVSIGPAVCGFYGSAELDGEEVLDGTVVSAWINSEQVQTTTTNDSKYVLNIPGDYTGEAVSFQVSGQPAKGSVLWVRGRNIQADLTAITTGIPSVTLELSALNVRPGEEFTISVNVDPSGHGISGGEIDLLSVNTGVMEILLDKVTAGTLLGNDPVEGVKEKTASDEGVSLAYALARKGTTPIPTDAGTLAILGLRIKTNAKAGNYAIPNAISLTDEAFSNLDFTPPTVSVTVIAVIPGDINGDDSVGLADLAILAAAYGTSSDEGSNFRSDADLNSDNEIGLGDLAILAGNWGQRS